MLLEDVQKLAEELMEQHGLHWPFWCFSFNKRKRHIGLCIEPSPLNNSPGRIELSSFYAVLLDKKEVTDTILHEIAHALVGVEQGHNVLWKTKCLEIGTLPKVTKYTDKKPVGKLKASCPSCKKTFYLYRRPKRPYMGRFCKFCGMENGQLLFKEVT